MNILGPKINNITTRFSSRDSLGIESVAATIAAELCPVINTVTPRAFYWPFMCWIYYDFHKNAGIKEKNTTTFAGYLRRQDYFFVLANLLADNPDQYNLVGKEKTGADKASNPDGPYEFNKNYFSMTYGGMNYYNAGCVTMRFLVEMDEETGKRYDFPKLTQFGEEMAIAFENVIKDTAYYKFYRRNNNPVPKEVLLEYAKIIPINLNGFDECKSILKRHLFGRYKKLELCAEYAKRLYSITNAYDISTRTARRLLFDYYSPRGDANEYPAELQSIICGWETVVGRHYFSTGIEMIWKYMLHTLDHPRSLNQWFEKITQEISLVSLDKTVETLLPECYFSHEERETMVAKARSNPVLPQAVTDGLKLVLSIYNRFKNRDDLGDAAVFLDYGRGKVPGTGAKSINEWISFVDRYQKKTVREFLCYIMREYIVEQHKRTCFEKITRSSQSIDGFYFEFVDGLYMKNEHVYQVDFQGNRFLQLMRIMNDLDMFEG